LDGNSILAGGVTAAIFNTAASGVNYVTVTPSATGGGGSNGPTLASTGADAAVDLNFDVKGASARYQWKFNSVTKADFVDVGGGSYQLRLQGGGGISADGGVVNATKLSWNNDASISRIAAGIVAVGTGASGSDVGVLQLGERAAPSGTANAARLYVVDNGGKTELYVIFGSGIAQLLAAEP
jgi:hypothetical protein